MYAPKYFRYSEFDSPDEKNSGLYMNENFIKRLDYARHLANVSFVIASGFRSKAFNQKLYDERKQSNSPYFVSKESEHTKGLASDIILNDENRYIILSAAARSGFTVFGIAKGFVHLALNSEKPKVYFYDIKDDKEKAKLIATISDNYQKNTDTDIDKKVKNFNDQKPIPDLAIVGLGILALILSQLK